MRRVTATILSLLLLVSAGCAGAAPDREAQAVGGGGYERGAPGASPPTMADYGAEEASMDREPGDATVAGVTAESPQRGVKVRQRFPESLLFEPALVTDANGHATLDLALADSITEWRITAQGSTATGAFGHQTTGLRVYQDVFMTLDAPRSLTVGDRITLRLAITCRLDVAPLVALDVETGSGLTLVAAPEGGIQLEAGSVVGVPITIEALTAGLHPLTIRVHDAAGTIEYDALIERLEVQPEGRPVDWVRHVWLQQDEELGLADWPEGALTEGRGVSLRLYPDRWSYLFDGVEAFATYPQGCLEQILSLTFCSATLLSHLERTGRANSALAARLREHVLIGLQRMVACEVNGTGSFRLYPSDYSAGSMWLSAMALQLMALADPLVGVDPRLLARTRAHVGTVRSSALSVGPELAAYSAWALLAAGDDAITLDGLLDWLLTQAPGQSPYGQALIMVAHAFAGREQAVTSLAASLGAQLDLVRITGEAGYETLSGAWRGAAHTETVALALLALAHLGLAETGPGPALLELLLEGRGTAGGWWTTQATFLATRALMELPDTARATAPITLVVEVDGELAGTLTVDPTAAKAPGLELAARLLAGERLTLRREGDGPPLALDVCWRARLPFTAPTGPTGLEVRFERPDVRSGERIACLVSADPSEMPLGGATIIEVGLPAHVRPEPGALPDLVRNGVIDRFELHDRQVVIYLGSLMQRLDLEVPLVGEFEGLGRSLPTRLYSYYAPDVISYHPPVRLEVVPNPQRGN